MAARYRREIRNPSVPKALSRIAACVLFAILLFNRGRFLPEYIPWVKTVSSVATAFLIGHVIWEIYVAVCEIFLATGWLDGKKSGKQD